MMKNIEQTVKQLVYLDIIEWETKMKTIKTQVRCYRAEAIYPNCEIGRMIHQNDCPCAHYSNGDVGWVHVCSNCQCEEYYPKAYPAIEAEDDE